MRMRVLQKDKQSENGMDKKSNNVHKKLNKETTLSTKNLIHSRWSPKIQISTVTDVSVLKIKEIFLCLKKYW